MFTLLSGIVVVISDGNLLFEVVTDGNLLFELLSIF
jgi:hypothetical protein